MNGPSSFVILVCILAGGVVLGNMVGDDVQVVGDMGVEKLSRTSRISIILSSC